MVGVGNFVKDDRQAAFGPFRGVIGRLLIHNWKFRAADDDCEWQGGRRSLPDRRVALGCVFVETKLVVDA